MQILVGGLDEQRFRRRRWRVAISKSKRRVVGPPRPPLSETVSRQMRAMPRRDTQIELAVRRELHRLGMRFRVHGEDLPGRPDIVLSRAKIAIFVDGCFWHLCPVHGTLPKNNKSWWADKLEGNVARDRRNDVQLQDLGWVAIHIWEHEDPVGAAAELYRIWRERIAESASHICQTGNVCKPGPEK